MSSSVVNNSRKKWENTNKENSGLQKEAVAAVFLYRRTDIW
jgi:hypothetical protein